MNRLDGIASVSVDLGARLATVEYDAEIVDAAAIQDAIDRANESMRPDDDNAEDARRTLG